jgi:SAM-dependent methyltransferase
MSTNIGDVRSFWNSSPCQADLSDAEDRRRYFEEISSNRYGRREWHVPIVARFDAFRQKEVLEIGCGIATDGLEFARNGAKYTGVDLTPQSIELARERFALFGMSGRLLVVNAEEPLPFPDESFDHVYSFGVIHHSPYPESIVRQIHRVLRPGGTFTVMLYNRSSINYYVEIMFVRKIFRWLLMPKFMPRLMATVTGFAQWKLEGHRDALIRKRDMSKEEWVSMNTDGPNCPLARVYNHAEATELFSDFRNVHQTVWEFNVDHWPFIRRLLPESTVKRIGRLWGWHRMIDGTKI